jgi:hypothetical protein
LFSATFVVQISLPVRASSATSTASAAAKNTLSPKSATPRLVGCGWTTSGFIGRRYRQSCRPSRASSAIT